MEISVEFTPEARLEVLRELLQKKFGPPDFHLCEANIYVIELKKSAVDLIDKRVFPGPDYPEIEMPGSDGFKGYLYVGYTQRSPRSQQLISTGLSPVEYRFKEEHKKGVMSAEVVQLHSLTDDYDSCGRNLTDKYGFKNVKNLYPNLGILDLEKLESWLGWALYNAGYWVWGPHAHKKEHQEKYGDFLGVAPFF